MSALTMCRGEGCQSRNSCARFTSQPDDHWQSWFSEVPVLPTGHCEQFVKDPSYQSVLTEPGIQWRSERPSEATA